MKSQSDLNHPPQIYKDLSRLADACAGSGAIRRQTALPATPAALVRRHGERLGAAGQRLPRLTPTAARLYGALRRAVSRGRAGICASARDIGEAIGASRASVFRALKELEALELVRRTQRYKPELWVDDAGRPHVCRQTTSVYRLGAAASRVRVAKWARRAAKRKRPGRGLSSIGVSKRDPYTYSSKEGVGGRSATRPSSPSGQVSSVSPGGDGGPGAHAPSEAPGRSLAESPPPEVGEGAALSLEDVEAFQAAMVERFERGPHVQR